MQFPGHLADAFFSDPLGEGDGERLGVLGVHEAGAAPGRREVEHLPAALRRHFGERPVEELLAGVRVFGEHGRGGIGRHQDRAFRPHGRRSPIEIDGLDRLQAVGHRPANDVGEPRIRPQAEHRGHAGLSPALVIGLLPHGVDAHAAVIHIGRARGQAGLEDVHLVAREGGDRVDADIGLVQQHGETRGVVEFQAGGQEAGIVEPGGQRLQPVDEAVRHHDPLDAARQLREQIAHRSGAHQAGASQDQDFHVSRALPDFRQSPTIRPHPGPRQWLAAMARAGPDDHVIRRPTPG